MSAVQFIVEGGLTLSGSIRPSGNKNAALPIVAAALLTDQPVTLTNVPRIRDLETLVDLVRTTVGVVAGLFIWATRRRLAERENPPFDVVALIWSALAVSGSVDVGGRDSRAGAERVGEPPRREVWHWFVLSLRLIMSTVTMTTKPRVSTFYAVRWKHHFVKS